MGLLTGVPRGVVVVRGLEPRLLPPRRDLVLRRPWEDDEEAGEEVWLLARGSSRPEAD